MQLVVSNELLYQKEVYHEINASYSQRLEQLQKSFMTALREIEAFDKQRGGQEVINIKRIQEVVVRVLTNDREVLLQQNARNISELKALVAVLKMEVQFNKRKPMEPKDKKSRDLEDEIKVLKKQIQAKESVDVGLEEMVNREIEKKIRIIEEDYILKTQHDRVLFEMEKSVREKCKAELAQEKRTDKYEQLYRMQEQLRKQQSNDAKNQIRRLQQRIEELEKQLEKANNKSMIKEELKQDVATSQLIGQEKNAQTSLEYNKETYLDVKFFSPRERKQNGYNYLEEIAKMGSQKTISSRANLPSDEQQKKITKKQLTIAFPTEFKESKISDHIEIVNKNFATQALERQSKKVNVPRTKFEEIQVSFARQLAELRMKMTEKREKHQQRLLSPDNDYTRLKPNIKEESAKRRNNLALATSYSPSKFRHR